MASVGSSINTNGNHTLASAAQHPLCGAPLSDSVMLQDSQEWGVRGNSFCVTQIVLQGVLLSLHTYCASLMVCYFLSWEEPINLKSVVGVSAGSAGTENKGREVLTSIELQPLT